MQSIPVESDLSSHDTLKWEFYFSRVSVFLLQNSLRSKKRSWMWLEMRYFFDSSCYLRFLRSLKWKIDWSFLRNLETYWIKLSVLILKSSYKSYYESHQVCLLSSQSRITLILNSSQKFSLPFPGKSVTNKWVYVLLTNTAIHLWTIVRECHSIHLQVL